MTIKDEARRASEEALANNCVKYVGTTYPHHPWACQVDAIGGVIKLIHQDLQQTKEPYIIRLAEVATEKVLQRALVKAGGEILERFRLSRERGTGSKVESEIMISPRDALGRGIIDKRDAANYV